MKARELATINKTYLIEQQYAGMNNYQHRRDFSQHGNNISTKNWLPLQYIDNYSLADRNKILEIGCGDGSFWKDSVGENQFLPSVWMTDLSRKMLEESKLNLSNVNLNVEYLLADIDALPFSTGTFDAILAHHVIYHSENPKQAIIAMHNVLKPEGFLGLSVLNKGVNQSIWELANSIDSQIPTQSFTARFTNVEADIILPEVFLQVEKRDYVNTLQFKTSEPIVNMVKSSPVVEPLKLSSNFYTLFKAKIDEEIIEKGCFESEFNGALYLGKKG